jgi:hypothetical protein
MFTMNRSRLAKNAAADTTSMVAVGRAAGNRVVVTPASRLSSIDTEAPRARSLGIASDA